MAHQLTATFRSMGSGFRFSRGLARVPPYLPVAGVLCKRLHREKSAQAKHLVADFCQGIVTDAM